MVDSATRDRDAPDQDALARIAHDEALRQEGVACMQTGLAERLGMRKTPGVVTHIDNEGWLHIDISIIAQHGTDLHQIGTRVQEAVIAAIRKVSDQPIGRVNVHVTQREEPSASEETLQHRPK